MSKIESRRWKALFIAAACLGGQFHAFAQDHAQATSPPVSEIDISRFTNGVREIGAPGIPGSVACLGPQARPIVVGKSDGGFEPVVVTASWGKGRVVAFGHNGYLSAEGMAPGDTLRLLLNVIGMARKDVVSRSAEDRDAEPKTLTNVPGLGRILKEQSVSCDVSNEASWAGQLVAGYQVACLDISDLSEEQSAKLREFVTGGGLLIAAQTGWGWQQLHGGAAMADNDLNRLLAPVGIAWTDAMLERTGGMGFLVGHAAPPPLCHAGTALTALIGLETKPLSEAELRQASECVQLALRCAQPDDSFLRPALKSFETRCSSPHPVPTAMEPLATSQPMSRIFLAEEIRRLSLLPSDQVQAHPSAAGFPGQPPADAPTTHASITFDPPSSGAACWRSTGLYARAGVPLKLLVAPQDELAQGASPPRIRIGCHTDSLWHLKEWKRCPEISRDWALAEGEQSVCSAFGGLVYVEFPERCAWPRFKIDIDGAVQAPLFVLGRDTPEVWRTRLRSLPGPWAELSTRKVSVTVPSELIRDLDDPEPVLRLWDTISDAAADLAAIPRDRPRAERYVADVQISAGYMHSGYPIMTHLDAAPAMVSVEKLKAGQWGLFHELGHNHQNPDWTFDGTGEVTVNLFSIYVCETVCGLGTRDGHPALKKLDEAAAEYIRAGSDFTQWKRDPFLALSMYIQLREAFGWEPFKRVFADYLALTPKEHPRSEDEKRDQWLVRMSRAVGRNLGPFFQMWGVPTSAAARAAISELPVWMPPGYPPNPNP